MTNILTLRIDPASQAHFDRMRQAHYPPALNRIAAHLTLFHSLPDTAEIAAALEEIARHPTFSLSVTGVRSLGRGVAYTLSSDVLLLLHTRLTHAFSAHLIPQDRQRFSPHVVIQNKATPEQARTLLVELQQQFQPFEVQAIGLDLWHYLGGPWQHTGKWLFKD